MDFSEKQAARSKWRSTQHLKRVHGGRGRGRGPQHHHQAAGTAHGDLDSNYDRYQLSDEEQQPGEGEPQRVSGGADLGQLLEEGQAFFSQAHYRWRAFIDTSSSEPPPVDVAALEQELAIEVGPLMQTLALLPLSELLGIDPDLLVDCPGLTAVDSQQQQQQQPQQQQLQPQQAPPRHQPQQVQPLSSRLPPFMSSAVSKPAVAATAAPAAAPPPPAAAAAQDDDDDEELLQLLTAGANCSTSSSTLAPAAVAAPLQPQRPPAAAAAATGRPGQQPPAAAAAAGRSGAADVDPLDLLLADTSGQPQQQVWAPPGSAAGGPGGSRKQSLEDWLDGL